MPRVELGNPDQSSKFEEWFNEKKSHRENFLIGTGRNRDGDKIASYYIDGEPLTFRSDDSIDSWIFKEAWVGDAHVPELIEAGVIFEDGNGDSELKQEPSKEPRDLVF